MVHEDITDNFSWISTEKRGLQTIPTSGWQYWDDGTGTWNDDPDLKFIQIYFVLYYTLQTQTTTYILSTVYYAFKV